MENTENGVRYRASARAFVGNYVLAAGLVVLSFLVGSRFDLGESQILIYVLFWSAAAILASESLVQGILKQYKVSGSEVVKIEGVLRKKRHSIPHQSVGQVKVSKGILGRLLNYGTVEVEGQNENNTIVMRHVHDPDEIRRIIRHKIDSYKVTPGKRATKRGEEPEDADEDIEGDAEEE
ncbi:MAG: PH domain-containing protein [Candidatus Aenigmarchaeota archaeon]|nr:PH domain-containing protein [Candidatus Aenigmarchaeota archaeon]